MWSVRDGSHGRPQLSVAVCTRSRQLSGPVQPGCSMARLRRLGGLVKAGAGAGQDGESGDDPASVPRRRGSERDLSSGRVCVLREGCSGAGSAQVAQSGSSQPAHGRPVRHRLAVGFGGALQPPAYTTLPAECDVRVSRHCPSRHCPSRHGTARHDTTQGVTGRHFTFPGVTQRH